MNGPRDHVHTAHCAFVSVRCTVGYFHFNTLLPAINCNTLLSPLRRLDCIRFLCNILCSLETHIYRHLHGRLDRFAKVQQWTDSKRTESTITRPYAIHRIQMTFVSPHNRPSCCLLFVCLSLSVFAPVPTYYNCSVSCSLCSTFYARKRFALKLHSSSFVENIKILNHWHHSCHLSCIVLFLLSYFYPAIFFTHRIDFISSALNLSHTNTMSHLTYKIILFLSLSLSVFFK